MAATTEQFVQAVTTLQQAMNLVLQLAIQKFNEGAAPPPPPAPTPTPSPSPTPAPTPTPSPPSPTPPAPSPGFDPTVANTKLADEGSIVGPYNTGIIVALGRQASNAPFSQINLASGQAFTCHPSWFPVDPEPGAIKVCYSLGPIPSSTPTPTPPAPSPGPQPLPAGTDLATEGNSFTVDVATIVAFGDKPTGRYSLAAIPAGVSTVCALIPIWGASDADDPAFLTGKTCWSTGTAAAPAPAPPPASGSGTALAGDIVDANGVVVASARDAMVAAVGTETWVNYLRGPAATNTNGGTKFFATPLTKWPDGYGESQVYYNYGPWMNIQGGGPFSTVQGDFIGVGTGGSDGVVPVQTAGYGNNVAELVPQKQWQRGYPDRHPNMDWYRANNILPTTGLFRTVFVTSGDDVVEDNGPSRVVGLQTANGQQWIVGLGSNTAANKAWVRLPDNKVMMAGAMSTQSEFLVVTVFDTTTKRNQICVIACAGVADGHSWTETALIGENWWNEWRHAYPLIFNKGNISFMKILGYLDMPTDMALATHIVTCTGEHPWEELKLSNEEAQGGGRNIGYYSSPIIDHLDDLRGRFSSAFARGAAVVAASLSDGDVFVYDFKPLISWALDKYLGADPSQATRDKLGLGDTQWPQTLTNSGVQIPLVKRIKTGGKIGDIRLTASNPSPVSGVYQALLAIGLRDQGKIMVYGMGDYVPGTARNKQGIPSQIAKISELSGLGPISNMAPVWGYKQTAGGAINGNTAWHFVSRGSRQVGTVVCNRDGTGLRIVKLYVPHKDQCLDPVAVVDKANYANESNAQDICDFLGQAICSFRTDALVPGGWPTLGRVEITPTNGIYVQFEGKMGLTVKPWDGCGANVP